MQFNVFNMGRFSRLSHLVGNHSIYPFLAVGLVFVFTNCFALPLSPDGGARNVSDVTLNSALPLFPLPQNWLRLFIEIALAVIGAVCIWRVVRSRRRLVAERLGGRRRAARFMARERKLRFNALRESRTLSRRLITAHEDERKHLARALHDDLSQRLARLAIDAAQGERGIPAARENGAWRRMREELVRLSDDLHSLAYRLHPSILEELGLAEALRVECDRLFRQETIDANVRLQDCPGEIPGETALCLFRVCQEALHNAVRHAHARAVDILLVRMDGGLQLSVHDDGIGFNPAKAREHASLGLTSMRERLHLANGELDVESEPGHGTTISAWVPLGEALKS